uniref:Uncharacterized protein n=1 Tax=Xenopus tropicalis TaxID=8364 RepID=A0A1B8XXA5_XENTR
MMEDVPPGPSPPAAPDRSFSGWGRALCQSVESQCHPNLPTNQVTAAPGPSFIGFRFSGPFTYERYPIL